MSETTTPVEIDDDVQAPKATAAKPGSLKARMEARSEELRERTSELFPVPLWDDMVAVELRSIDWDVTQDSVERNMRRSRKVRMQNTAGDEIVTATVAFWEIGEDGEIDEENGRIEDAANWYEIATKLAKKRLPNTNERVALVAMCGTQGVISLNTTYRQWLNGAEVGIRAAMRRDF